MNTTDNAPPSAAVDNSVEAKSVRGLVHIHRDQSADRWQLSVVQRNLVWDATRARYLLDSLIRGYPIGTLLLCRVRTRSYVLHDSIGPARVAEKADAEQLQLLDGQQRVNALSMLFSGGEDTRFLVHLTAQERREGVARRQRSREEALRYIIAEQPATGGEATDTKTPPPRGECMDVSRFYEHDASSASMLDWRNVEIRTDAELFALAHEIDPLCDGPALLLTDETTRARATQRIRALVRAWSAPVVPVQRLDLDGPRDVLQVFARINLAGVDVAGDDIFFAAVKTIWAQAEQHVQAFRAGNSLLGRRESLRLMARLASIQGTPSRDLVPLEVERLEGTNGEALVARMRSIGSTASPEKARVDELARWLRECSGLGYGLRAVNKQLLDQVFAWGAGRTKAPSEAELTTVAAYLVGGTLFRYAQIFDVAFFRLAFEAAAKAGVENGEFPLRGIVAACRREWNSLKKGRQTVAGITEPSTLRTIAHDAYQLVLPIVQEIPFDPPSGHAVDWEHLYPSARTDRMWWKGLDGKVRWCHHPHRPEAFRVGNLYALDRRTNQSPTWGAKWPSEKLARHEAELDIWPRELFLGAEERDNLQQAEAKLRVSGLPEPDASKVVDEGMAHFAAYAQRRADRIIQKVFDKFPLAARFARDDLTEEDPSKP